jgi:hypothetical protein
MAGQGLQPVNLPFKLKARQSRFPGDPPILTQKRPNTTNAPHLNGVGILSEDRGKHLGVMLVLKKTDVCHFVDDNDSVS